MRFTFSRLQQEFDLTHQEVAEAVGKSRTTVTNLLRLMSLREDVQRLLEHGDLEMGHARALLSLEKNNQVGAARQVVSKALSVRQTEALVKSLQQPKKVKPDLGWELMWRCYRPFAWPVTQNLHLSVSNESNNRFHGQPLRGLE